MKKGSVPPTRKLSLSRETLQRLESALAVVEGGGSRFCSATSSSCSETTCVSCTITPTHCDC